MNTFTLKSLTDSLETTFISFAIPLPQILWMTSTSSPLPEVENTSFPSALKVKETLGKPKARCSQVSMHLAFSVLAPFIYFSLAGVLKNKSLTLITVPFLKGAEENKG